MRVQDSSNDEMDRDVELPTLLTSVRLDPTAKAQYCNALRHWASVTREVQVLPRHIAQDARVWLN